MPAIKLTRRRCRLVQDRGIIGGILLTSPCPTTSIFSSATVSCYMEDDCDVAFHLHQNPPGLGPPLVPPIIICYFSRPIIISVLLSLEASIRHLCLRSMAAILCTVYYSRGRSKHGISILVRAHEAQCILQHLSQIRRASSPQGSISTGH